MIKQKYTIVPLEEYKDTSGISMKEMELVFKGVNFLFSTGIRFSFVKEKGTLIKVGDTFREKTKDLYLSDVEDIVQIKNGQYRLLCRFRRTLENEHDYIEKLVVVDQEYFPTFLMPFFKLYKEWLRQQELLTFFEALYVSDKKYVTLHKKVNELRILKNNAVKLQDNERAAGIRDKENIAVKNLNTHLISKVIALKEEKPYLDIADWINLAIDVKKPI